MNIFQRMLSAVLSGGKQQQVELPTVEPLFKYLGLRADDFDLEPRGDRVGDTVTYQWTNHGPFTVHKVTDETTTEVTLSSNLEQEFTMVIEGAYNQYLQPWREKGLPVPKVIVKINGQAE